MSTITFNLNLSSGLFEDAPGKDFVVLEYGADGELVKSTTPEDVVLAIENHNNISEIELQDEIAHIALDGDIIINESYVHRFPTVDVFLRNKHLIVVNYEQGNVAKIFVDEEHNKRYVLVFGLVSSAATRNGNREIIPRDSEQHRGLPDDVDCIRSYEFISQQSGVEYYNIKRKQWCPYSDIISGDFIIVSFEGTHSIIIPPRKTPPAPEVVFDYVVPFEGQYISIQDGVGYSLDKLEEVILPSMFKRCGPHTLMARATTNPISQSVKICGTTFTIRVDINLKSKIEQIDYTDAYETVVPFKAISNYPLKLLTKSTTIRHEKIFGTDVIVLGKKKYSKNLVVRIDGAETVGIILNFVEYKRVSSTKSKHNLTQGYNEVKLGGDAERYVLNFKDETGKNCKYCVNPSNYEFAFDGYTATFAKDRIVINVNSLLGQNLVDVKMISATGAITHTFCMVEKKNMVELAAVNGNLTATSLGKCVYSLSKRGKYDYEVAGMKQDKYEFENTRHLIKADAKGNLRYRVKDDAVYELRPMNPVFDEFKVTFRRVDVPATVMQSYVDLDIKDDDIFEEEHYSTNSESVDYVDTNSENTELNSDLGSEMSEKTDDDESVEADEYSKPDESPTTDGDTDLDTDVNLDRESSLWDSMASDAAPVSISSSIASSVQLDDIIEQKKAAREARRANHESYMKAKAKCAQAMEESNKAKIKKYEKLMKVYKKARLKDERVLEKLREREKQELEDIKTDSENSSFTESVSDGTYTRGMSERNGSGSSAPQKKVTTFYESYGNIFSNLTTLSSQTYSVMQDGDTVPNSNTLRMNHDVADKINFFVFGGVITKPREVCYYDQSNIQVDEYGNFKISSYNRVLPAMWVFLKSGRCVYVEFGQGEMQINTPPVFIYTNVGVAAIPFRINVPANYTVKYFMDSKNKTKTTCTRNLKLQNVHEDISMGVTINGDAELFLPSKNTPVSFDLLMKVCGNGCSKVVPLFVKTVPVDDLLNPENLSYQGQLALPEDVHELMVDNKIVTPGITYTSYADKKVQFSMCLNEDRSIKLYIKPLYDKDISLVVNQSTKVVLNTSIKVKTVRPKSSAVSFSQSTLGNVDRPRYWLSSGTCLESAKDKNPVQIIDGYRYYGYNEIDAKKDGRVKYPYVPVKEITYNYTPGCTIEMDTDLTPITKYPIMDSYCDPTTHKTRFTIEPSSYSLHENVEIAWYNEDVYCITKVTLVPTLLFQPMALVRTPSITLAKGVLVTKVNGDSVNISNILETKAHKVYDVYGTYTPSSGNKVPFRTVLVTYDPEDSVDLVCIETLEPRNNFITGSVRDVRQYNVIFDGNSREVVLMELFNLATRIKKKINFDKLVEWVKKVIGNVSSFVVEHLKALIDKISGLIKHRSLIFPVRGFIEDNPTLASIFEKIKEVAEKFFTIIVQALMNVLFGSGLMRNMDIENTQYTSLPKPIDIAGVSTSFAEYNNSSLNPVNVDGQNNSGSRSNPTILQTVVFATQYPVERVRIPQYILTSSRIDVPLGVEEGRRHLAEITRSIAVSCELKSVTNIHSLYNDITGEIRVPQFIPIDLNGCFITSNKMTIFPETMTIDSYDDNSVIVPKTAGEFIVSLAISDTVGLKYKFIVEPSQSQRCIVYRKSNISISDFSKPNLKVVRYYMDEREVITDEFVTNSSGKMIVDTRRPFLLTTPNVSVVIIPPVISYS